LLNAPKSCKKASANLGLSKAISSGMLIKVMTHHQHICVHLGCLGVRRTILWKKAEIIFTTNFNDVRCVTAASAFSMISMDHTIFKSSDRCFYKSSFKVSVWIATWTSYRSATLKQVSIVRSCSQSSCSFADRPCCYLFRSP